MDQQDPSPKPRRFLRARDDRFIGGVCGGLGRYCGVDPVLFRVGAVALTFAGGLAVLVYAVLWVVAPADDGSGGESVAPLRRLLGGADGRIRAGRLLAVTAIVVGGVLAAVLLIVGAAWATASGGGVWVACGVIAMGVAAVAGALAGRRGVAWLVVPALLVAASAGFVAAADVRFEGAFGDERYQPTSVSALPPQGYRLAAGRMRVDLRDLALARGTTTEIPIHVGMGVATIIVPRSVCVESDTKVGAGYVDVLGDTDGGLDVLRDVAGAQGPAPRVLLRAQVGMGALEVVHRPEDARFLDHGSEGSQQEGGGSLNAACGQGAST